MNLKTLWEQYRAHHRMRLAPPSLPLPVSGRKLFQPLTHDESVAILEESIQWLIDEARDSLAMPNGRSKDRRRTELRGRHESIVRDFARLVRKQRD